DLADEQDPEHGGGDSPSSAGQGGAPDDYGGYQVERIADTSVGIRAAGLGHSEHAGDTCRQSEERQCADLHAVDVHAGELCCSAVATKRVEVLTKGGAAEEQVP